MKWIGGPYGDKHGRFVPLWERVLLLFVRRQIVRAEGLITVYKIWRGRIYVLAQQEDSK